MAKPIRFRRPGPFFRPDQNPQRGPLVDRGQGLKNRGPTRPKRGVTFGQPPKGKRNPNRRNPNQRNRQNNRPRPPRIDPMQKEIDALTQLQYGGQQSQLDAERRISGQHSANLGGWYQNYVNQLQGAAQAQAAYTKGLQDAAYGQANQMASTDQAQNTQLLQQQQQDAAQRGTTVDPSVAQNMQAGVAARQTQGTAFGGLLAAQGQAQTGYLNSRVGVGAGQGIQAQQDEMSRRRKIDELARELQSEIGAFKVKSKMDIEEGQHKKRLENAAFGLDVQQEANDVEQAAADDKRADKAERRQQAAERRQQASSRLTNKSTRADIKAKRGKAALDRQADLADDGKRNNSIDYSEWAQRSRPDKSGSGRGSGKNSKFTPTQLRSNRSSLRNLVHRVKSNIDPPDSVDPLLARAAVQIADKGGVTPELARKIRRNFGFTPKVKRKGRVGAQVQETGGRRVPSGGGLFG